MMYSVGLNFEEQEDLLFVVEFEPEGAEECALYVYKDDDDYDDILNYIRPVVVPLSSGKHKVISECYFKQFYLFMFGKIENRFNAYRIFNSDKIINVRYRGKNEQTSN